MELHTYSSLNKEFLSQYKGSFTNIDTPVVFYSPETVANKGLESISKQDIMDAFEEDNLLVLTKADELKQFINESNLNNHVLLMMSSGNWGGMDLNELSKELLSKWN